MAVTYWREGSIPEYACLSTDVTSGSVGGISTKGSRVFFTDTGTWWIVGDDLKLISYAMPVAMGTSGSAPSKSGSTVYVENLSQISVTLSGSGITVTAASLVQVTNFPTTFSGSITNFPNTFSGSITNLPAIQITSGCITNLPTIQITSGCITNFPTTQVTSGCITNFPTTQITSGCITNFPTSQVVVGPVLSVDSNFSGQIYVSSSVVNYSGSNLSVTNLNGFIFKPHPSNSGVIWIVANGGYISGSQATGFSLSVGDIFPYSGSSLSKLDYGISGATTGCLCWAKL